MKDEKFFSSLKVLNKNDVSSYELQEYFDDIICKLVYHYNSLVFAAKEVATTLKDNFNYDTTGHCLYTKPLHFNFSKIRKENINLYEQTLAELNELFPTTRFNTERLEKIKADIIEDLFSSFFIEPRDCKVAFKLIDYCNALSLANFVYHKNMDVITEE